LSEPLVSIVVPTYNRASRLEKIVAFLAQQHTDFEYEVIFSDDGSTDNTLEICKEISQKYKHIYYTTGKHQGINTARNRGILAARGRFIAFTDDDCEPDRNWLQNLIKPFSYGKDVVGVEGRIVSEQEISPFWHVVVNEQGGRYWTANIAYKKESLLKVGMFDEGFIPIGYDDWDIAIRMKRIGRIVFNKKAVVKHPPRQVKFFSAVRRMIYYKNLFRIYAKYPQWFKSYHKAGPFKQLYYNIMIRGSYNTLMKNLFILYKSPGEYFKVLSVVIFRVIYLILLFPVFSFHYLKQKQEFSGKE